MLRTIYGPSPSVDERPTRLKVDKLGAILFSYLPLYQVFYLCIMVSFQFLVGIGNYPFPCWVRIYYDGLFTCINKTYWSMGINTSFTPSIYNTLSARASKTRANLKISKTLVRPPPSIYSFSSTTRNQQTNDLPNQSP